MTAWVLAGTAWIFIAVTLALGGAYFVQMLLIGRRRRRVWREAHPYRFPAKW